MAKITCVGCGMMGSNIVEAFMNGGHEVFIVDVVDKNALKYIEKGAKYSKDINDALDCDFIVLSLPNDKIVLKAFLIESATPFANKGGTAFPICLNASPILQSKKKSSGNDCSLAASLTLMPLGSNGCI